MYISEHPILGTDACQQMVNITVDGRPLQVKAGSMITEALLANRITPVAEGMVIETQNKE